MRISRTLEQAFSLAVNEARRRRHEFLSIEHMFYALLHDGEVAETLRNCGGDVAAFKRDMEAYLDEKVERLPEGVEKTLQQTLGFQRVIQRAAAHVQSVGKDEIDVENVLVALFREPESHAAFLLAQQGVTRLDVVSYISHGISKLGQAKQPSEGADPSEDAEDAEADEAGAPRKVKKPLEAFTVNLVEMAAAGKIDPLIGRAREIERTIRVLCRRRKNNPVYVGDAGVGKTAIAEGFALKIERGDVPEKLKNVNVYALDMGALLAGTRFRGDFEQRLKDVLGALKNEPGAILFIDEIHTVVGAGATSGGSLDASNILKPALASGELRCIGATTFHDYKSFFERDRALARRFQRIEVAEPTIEETHQILKGLKSRYEEHHGVTYSDGALRSAAELAAKHINDRFLPDKAIDVIDEAGASLNVRGGGAKQRKVVRTKDIEHIVASIAKIPARS
ncbi:MAG: Clp protease N-terminal domain-containing protein, partial [Candidatus Binatia bacterium]